MKFDINNIGYVSLRYDSVKDKHIGYSLMSLEGIKELNVCNKQITKNCESEYKVPEPQLYSEKLEKLLDCKNESVADFIPQFGKSRRLTDDEILLLYQQSKPQIEKLFTLQEQAEVILPMFYFYRGKQIV